MAGETCSQNMYVLLKIWNTLWVGMDDKQNLLTKYVYATQNLEDIPSVHGWYSKSYHKHANLECI